VDLYGAATRIRPFRIVLVQPYNSTVRIASTKLERSGAVQGGRFSARAAQFGNCPEGTIYNPETSQINELPSDIPEINRRPSGVNSIEFTPVLSGWE
jgi:hypothetical protein